MKRYTSVKYHRLSTTREGAELEMIRFRRLTPTLLNAWLVDQGLPNRHGRYRLRVWREHRPALAALKPELELYLNEAFDDARRRLRRGFEDNLSPFNDPSSDPASNYPALLNRVTLQAYFGETLAVLAVEHWGAHGHSDWKVPAFLFRLHDQEFQHLELINERLRVGQTHYRDTRTELRPDRTGDDGLAFRMNAENVITDVLTLEAKCLDRNQNAKIQEAHKKLAAAGLLPPGVRELINLLSEYDTPEAKGWQQALLKLRFLSVSLRTWPDQAPQSIRWCWFLRKALAQTESSSAEVCLCPGSSGR